MNAATVTVKVAVRDWPLLIPVTVTVNVPAAVKPVHESALVWSGGRLTLDGVRVQVGPTGATAEDRVTMPENPPRPVTEIVEEAVPPTPMVTAPGLALRAKSVTVNEKVCAPFDEPGVPVTVTVAAPRVAERLAVKVKVEVHVGLQLVRAAGVEVTPAGRPLRAKLTG